MADVLIAKTCPICKGRAYTKKGAKYVCPAGCVPKKKKAPTKPPVVEPTEETPDGK